MADPLADFCKRIEDQLNRGVTAVAADIDAAWRAELIENDAVRAGREYFGSEPGESPYNYKGWFKNALGHTTSRGMEAEVGMTLEHPGIVMRLLVEGTKTIEPRKGPEDIIKENEALLVDSFFHAACRN